jgi:epsin
MDCSEILDVLDRRLNDKGKNWRHVFKSLVLLENLLRFGSYNIVRYYRCASVPSFCYKGIGRLT